MVADVALTLLAAGFAAALLLAALLLRGPERLRIYSHPNARSLHERPTATGGGICFVLPLLGYLTWLALEGVLPALTLALGGGVLALIGWWDDRREVSKGLRFAVQIAVAAAVAWSLLGGAPWWAVPLAAIALAWHVNLYNFMDGIDGLAGAQALVFAVGAHIVGQGVPGWPGDLLWLMAGSVLGFLVLNWPPARLFMGDLGSYFLGLITAAVAVLLWQKHTLALPVCLILLAGFWFDATYTLIIRTSTGQAFTQPHKTHLYQKIAAKRGHLWTTVCYLLYAVSWLLPLSWMAGRSATELTLVSLFWVLPAVTPLAIAAWWLRAGLPESSGTFSSTAASTPGPAVAGGSRDSGGHADGRHDQ